MSSPDHTLPYYLYDDIVLLHPDIKAPLTLEYISSHKFALKKLLKNSRLRSQAYFICFSPV